MTGAAPSLRATVAGAVVVTAALLYGTPYFGAWLAANLRPEAVHTSALDCPRPTEFEHLHIVVRLNARGRLEVEDCMYVGAKGAYYRGRR